MLGWGAVFLAFAVENAIRGEGPRAQNFVWGILFLAGGAMELARPSPKVRLSWLLYLWLVLYGVLLLTVGLWVAEDALTLGVYLLGGVVFVVVGTRALIGEVAARRSHVGQ
jgi:hypothetical protein